MFRVYITKEVEKTLQKIKGELQEILLHIIQNLAFGQSGKILRFPWLREKKLGNYRIIFIVTEDIRKVLVVCICTKKEQQHELDIIFSKLVFFQSYIRDLE